MAQKQNFPMGKGTVVLYLVSKYIHPSLWVRNHHVNISKDHQLERMKFWQRELKEIRGKDAMAIMVTAPGTVDDVDTTKLYALENDFQIIFDGDPDTFYYDEGDYLLEEAAEGEVMHSELLKLVKCTTGAVLDTYNIASQLDLLILVLTMPQHLKSFFIMKLQTICLPMSDICQEFATGAC